VQPFLLRNIIKSFFIKCAVQSPELTDKPVEQVKKSWKQSLQTHKNRGRTVEEMLDQISNVGFLIVVSVYFLVRFERKIVVLTKSIDHLNLTIENMTVRKPA
jgi:hypothetical protein